MLPAPTQIDSTNGGCALGLLVCVLAAHRSARAMTPTTISTAAKAMVKASRKSVSTSDLYIVLPRYRMNPQRALRCKSYKASPRLKLASIDNFRGRTRGEFVIAIIERAITNRSSRSIKELGNSRSHYVNSVWSKFRSVLPVHSVDNWAVTGVAASHTRQPAIMREQIQRAPNEVPSATRHLGEQTVPANYRIARSLFDHLVGAGAGCLRR